MPTALVTGASVGLGRGFAEKLAEQGFDIVAVARNQERLSELATYLSERFGVGVEVISADLSTELGIQSVKARIAEPIRPIDCLVNNAGFGIGSSFLHSTSQQEQDLITVLVSAPMQLTKAALPSMLDRDTGWIINVSSVASWVPGGTYSAAKAWARVFTESLSIELDGTNVKATAVCPGFTHTELHQRADINMDSLPDFMWLDVDDVVSRGLRDVKAGRAVSVAGAQYRAISAITRYVPDTFLRWAIKKNPRFR